MYVSQTKSKNGILIVEDQRRFFISWEDLQLLKEGKYMSKNNKPIIVISEMKSI